MIDQKIIIAIGDHRVLSELVYDDGHPDRTVVRITSTCEDHSAVNLVTIKHLLGYSAEQAEFDIEEARWRYAEAVAGKKEVRATMSALLAGGDAAPRLVTRREHVAPRGQNPI